jgi:hypothetical protein
MNRRQLFLKIITSYFKSVKPYIVLLKQTYFTLRKQSSNKGNKNLHFKNYYNEKKSRPLLLRPADLSVYLIGLPWTERATSIISSGVSSFEARV